MREIKFRALDENRVWWYFTLEDLIRKPGAVTDALSYWSQFTGLKDKNGKEIYEGDILDVKFNPHYVERIDWKGSPDARCEVFWDFAGFRLRAWNDEDKRYADLWDTDGYTDGILDMNRDHSEIIGNIYETPELLK